MDILQRIRETGILPVVVLEQETQAAAVAHALSAGGVTTMEITLRTRAGLPAIRRVRRECPKVVVGAGTVLSLEEGKRCVEAGAGFLVSPGLNKELALWCAAQCVPYFPGCVTPTEIMEALALGIKLIKFFPADVYGGIPAMKALAAPFGEIRFIPTGGVRQDNLAEYCTAPFVYAVGGSWLCRKQDINEENYEKITSLCAQARDILRCARG